MSTDLSHSEIFRYSRHLLIPEIGLEGQKKLKTSSVLIVGTGGLGSPVALYLSGAGVGTIGLIDYDIVESSNLQRQIIHGESTLDQDKVDSAKKRMLDINPYIDVKTYNEPINSVNAPLIVEPYDLIIDCSDNFPTRYLINDLSVFTGKPNVFGAVYRFDGQASVFNINNGPCYRCIFPEPPPSGLIPSCSEGGVLGILPGTIGTIQATEAIKIILGIGSILSGKLLLYNALDMTFDIVKLRKNPDCKVCGSTPEITELIDYEDFCGINIQNQDLGSAAEQWDISANDLAEKIKSNKSLKIVDVREPHELDISHIEGAILIPLGEFASRLSELETNEEIVLICKAGIRSSRALEILRSSGFDKVKNLKGGINSWSRLVDPTQPIY